MVPDGWISTHLGNAFKNRRQKGKAGMPTLSVTLNDGLVDRSSLDRKTDTNLADEEHLCVMPGDIAYNMMRMWQGASGLSNKEGLVSPAYVVLAANKTVHPDFMAYLFKSPRMIHLFWAYSYGLTDDRLRLYFKDFSAIPVLLPPLIEQKRIADILQTWDRAIDVTSQLIRNSELQHAAFMETLFSAKLNLKGVSGTHKPLRLGDLVRIDARSLASNTPPAYQFHYISLAEVNSGTVTIPSECIRFDQAPSRARRIVTEGDILMATVRPNLQAFAMVPAGARDCVASTGFAVLTAKPEVSPSYVYHYLFSKHISRQIDALVVGSSYPAIGSKEVAKLAINCPGIEEQARIAALLDNSSNVIKCLRNSLGALHKEKQSLMQQLLTGKRRVSAEQSIKERASA